MSKLVEIAKKFLDEVKKHKIRVGIGVAAGLLLCLLSILFLHDCGMKTYFVCFVLSLATGVVIAFPKPDMPKKWGILIGAVVLIFYGLVVPNRLFGQTELFVSDLTPLINGTPYLNICILFMGFFVLLFFLQRASLALGVEGIVVLLLALINYFTTTFRGTGLSFVDFGAVKTATMVMGNYHYEFTVEAWKSILYIVFFTALGFRIDIPLKGWKYHIGATAVAIAGFGISLTCFHFSGVWETPGIKGESGNINGGEKAFGLYYYLYLTSQATGMEKSFGYSYSALSRIAKEAGEAYEPTGGYVAAVKKPNVILIMNEAWSDLRVLGDMQTSESYMPFFDSLCASKNTVSGSAYVNIIGGMTCNSEFEALTGDSMAFLHIAAIPYSMQVNHSMSSIASVLGAQGYQTVAMHPNGAASWSRGDVYENMGFDEFVTIDKFHVEMEMIGGYVSDESNMEELIYLFENRDTTKPFFGFNVTIQNHSPYAGQYPIINTVTSVNGKPLENSSVEDQYVSLMKVSDDALEKLITYFEGVDEPTMICMFGDHQPILSETTYNAFFEGRGLSQDQQKSLEYRTPYFIWTNYDSNMPQYGDISASHIGVILCELAGVDLPEYYKFILNSRKSVPAFHAFSSYTKEQEELLEKYRILQYNQLMEKAYRRDIFEVN